MDYQVFPHRARWTFPASIDPHPQSQTSRSKSKNKFWSTCSSLDTLLGKHTGSNGDSLYWITCPSLHITVGCYDGSSYLIAQECGDPSLSLAHVINGRHLFTAGFTCFARARSRGWPRITGRWMCSAWYLSWSGISRINGSSTSVDAETWQAVRKGGGLMPSSHRLRCIAEMFLVKVSSGCTTSINPSEMICQPLSCNVEQMFHTAPAGTDLMILQSQGKAYDIIIPLRKGCE